MHLLKQSIVDLLQFNPIVTNDCYILMDFRVCQKILNLNSNGSPVPRDEGKDDEQNTP